MDFFPRVFSLTKLEALEGTALLSLPATVFRLLEVTDVFSNLQSEKQAASSPVSLSSCGVGSECRCGVYCLLSSCTEAKAPSVLALGCQTPLHSQSPGLSLCAVQSFPEQNLS